MIAIALAIQVPEIIKTQLSKRALDRCLKAANEVTGKVHHEKIVPKHFDRNAKSKYDYTPRSAGYKAAKKNAAAKGKAQDADTDLVWSGRTKQAFTQFAVVRAFPTRYTVTMQGPNYFTMKPNPRGKRPSRVWMFGDLQQVNADDMKLLEGTYKKELEEQLTLELAKIGSWEWL